MNEHHVTSLELSKKLKEAGVEQKSEFYWVFEYKKWSIKKFKDQDGVLWAEDFPERVFSAFLASELAEMLPDGYSIFRCQGYWYCQEDNPKSNTPQKSSKSPPDALGEMMLYLKQNNLLKEASV